MNNKAVKALVKEQFKRFWAIPALTMLGYLLFILTNLYDDTWGRAAANMVGLLSMQNAVMLASSIIVPVCTALLVFSYFCSGRATTAFHSFPIKKSTLFFANYVVGLILILVPLAIFSLMLLTPVHLKMPFSEQTVELYNSYYSFVRIPTAIYPHGIYEGMVVNPLPVVLGFFFRTALTFVFYFTLFSLACVLAGNRIIAFLLCGAFPLIPLGILTLGYVIGEFFIFGLDSSNFMNTWKGFLIYTNPAIWGNIIAEHNYAPWMANDMPVAVSLLPGYVSYSLISVSLLIAAFACVIKRKEERAGDSVVFTIFKNVLIFLLSLLGAITMCAFLLSIKESSFNMYGGYVLGFVVSWYIAQMIAEKTVNVLYKAKSILSFGGVMLGLYVVTVLFARLDVLGYERRIPDASQVEGVYIHKYYYDYSGNYISDADIITRTLDVHQQTVNNRTRFRKNMFFTNDKQNLRITYKLHKGDTLTRSYNLPLDFLAETGINTLQQTEEVILSHYNSFHNPHWVESISIYTHRMMNNYLNDYTIEEIKTLIDPVHIAKLLEVIKWELIATEREGLNTPQDEYYDEVRVNVYMDRNLWETNHISNDHFDLRHFKNTIAWLEEHGYAQEGLYEKLMALGTIKN